MRWISGIWVDETLDIYGDLPGQQELLLVELFGHLLLERLVEELAKENDERENDEEREDEDRRREQLFFPERPDNTLKHEVIYCQKRGKVKESLACVAFLYGPA